MGNTAFAFRVSKVVAVTGTGLLALLVVFNNLTDYFIQGAIPSIDISVNRIWIKISMREYGVSLFLLGYKLHY